MSKLVIHTQYKENYGAHDWDGEGACPQYWKFKGGDTYVVENLSNRSINQIQSEGLPHLGELLEYSDDYSEVYITTWRIAEDWEEITEEWEAATVLQFDPESREWVAERFTVNDQFGCMRADITSKREFWVPQPGGAKDCYSQQFTMVDGSVLSYSELADWFEANA